MLENDASSIILQMYVLKIYPSATVQYGTRLRSAKVHLRYIHAAHGLSGSTIASYAKVWVYQREITRIRSTGSSLGKLGERRGNYLDNPDFYRNNK